MGAGESQRAIGEELFLPQEENGEREPKCLTELMRTAWFWVVSYPDGLLVAPWAAHCTGVRAWGRDSV